MATITSNGTGGGDWSAGATWVGGSAPADGDAVVIAAGDTVTMDSDLSAWATGVAGLTITSHATTPGMLVFSTASGTHYLKMKNGTTINGTNAATKGRLLANSDGVWGNTGAMPFASKCIIDLLTTAYVDATYLDIALYCTQPANTSVRVYQALKDVSSIDTGTDVITMTASHGWSANTAVCVKSSGTLPAPLAADTVYYVGSPSGADLKLLYTSGGTEVDLTSAGTGTIQLYDGHTDTGTGTVNVLDDVTADAAWVTTDGDDAVVLVDAAAPEGYDQQRLQLTTINAGSLVLSANVDSAQYPNARVFLMSRNVRIISACTTTVNLVNNASSAVLQCEIRSTAGTGTTFYGNGLGSGCASCTVSGTVSGCNTGVNQGTGHTVSGTVSGCSNGISGGTGHTVSGTVSGCNSGISGGTGHTVSGTVSGCSNGVNQGTGHTVSGTVSGCNTGISGGTGHTVSGTVSGCNTGISVGTGHTVSGTVSGCSTGIYGGTGHTVSGTVSGCNTGIYSGTGRLVHSAVLSENVRDIYHYSGDWRGYGSSLNSTTQVDKYKHADNASTESRNCVIIQDLALTSGYLGCWTLGGFTKTAAYSAGTHGTPPVASDFIHEMTYQDNDRLNYVELPVRGKKDTQITVTFYGKLTALTAWTTRPTVGIYDPNEPWQDASEDLAVSSEMANNTDWQTLTVTYTPTYDRELNVRVQGQGGDAGGTGTEQLYWFMTVAMGTASGGLLTHPGMGGGMRG